MKARLVLEQYADVSKLNAEQRKVVTFRPDRMNAGKTVCVFPEGAVFEGEQALFLCKTGQAEPVDDECMKATKMTPGQRAAIQENYKMDSLGINDKADRELYRAGVILGYHPKDKTYIHGPNWNAYQLAQEAADDIFGEDDGLDDDPATDDDAIDAPPVELPEEPDNAL